MEYYTKYVLKDYNKQGSVMVNFVHLTQETQETFNSTLTSVWPV